MSLTSKTIAVATGFAMFSMFFGAGNIVFPLALGQMAQDKHFFALAGMLISSVIVPFAGLIAMFLFDGDYEAFFGRMGRIPGFVMILIILGLIGPFGAIPRCIALSYSTVKMLAPGVSLPLFSALSCVIIWLFTFRRSLVIDSLGYILTPFLLTSLGIIIVRGLLLPYSQETSHEDPLALFLRGLKDGYQTMDLLGAFFFSSVVIVGLKSEVEKDRILPTALKASAIGAVLLSLVYLGFSIIAARHGTALGPMPADQLISSIALHLLGPYASAVACVAVALACLTTAIALSAVFAEFIHTDIAHDKINYNYSLCATLVIAFFVSTLDFNGIVALLLPILQIAYPALIVLTLVNILYKLFGFKPIKTPVYVTLLLSIALALFRA